MARFEKVDLYVNVKDGYVNFAITPEVYFEEYEKGITWSFTMKFFEHDTFSSDDFIFEVTHIIKPETIIEGEKIIITPRKLNELFKEKIKEERADKSWFTEKVYVDLKLKPIQTLTPAFIRSNFVEFNV